MGQQNLSIETSNDILEGDRIVTVDIFHEVERESTESGAVKLGLSLFFDDRELELNSIEYPRSDFKVRHQINSEDNQNEDNIQKTNQQTSILFESVLPSNPYPDEKTKIASVSFDLLEDFDNSEVAVKIPSETAQTYNNTNVESLETKTLALELYEPSLAITNVHRFYQYEKGFHLYTSDTNEIKVVKELSSTGKLKYNYENETFAVLADRKDTLTGATIEDVKPVYRFYNTSTGAHIYTMDENEKGYIQDNLDSYNFEGITYYAFESEPKNIETVPVYRLYNNIAGTHLFTIDQNEINYIQNNLPHFSIEGNDGVAFHVFDLEN